MPRAAKRLTKTDLDGLRRKAEADPGFRSTLADAGQPGLYVQARRGRVRFLFRFRPPDGGNRVPIQIDDYGAVTLEQAREIAQEWRGLVASGRDPRAELRQRRREATTVRDAARAYLRDYQRRVETGARRGKRSGLASARRRLERHVLPRLGDVPVGSVTVERVRALHRSMAKTPVEANRTLTVLSAVFGEAAQLGLVAPGFNPARHVERFDEKGSRRALTEAELRRLGEAIQEAEETGAVTIKEEAPEGEEREAEEADESAKEKKAKRYAIHPSALLALRLMALTGMRRAEILGHEAKARRGPREGLRWADVDLEAGLVHLRDTKTGDQTRPLGRAALDLLKAARPADADPDAPVCPGAVRGQPFIGLDRARIKLYRAAEIHELPGVDTHSLRHTFASMGANIQSGHFAAHVGPLLGHGYTEASSITERYIHSSPEALRPAVDAISEAIARRLAGASGRVVAMRTAGA